jgi:hypothetical protein
VSRNPTINWRCGRGSLRKEDNAMNYTKPKVNVLGNAVNVIELLAKPFGQNADGTVHPIVYDFPPAYDLDE